MRTGRSQYRLVLLLALTLGALAALGLTLRQGRLRATAADAALPPARPSPGQLTITGKNGGPVALCPLTHTDVKADVAGYVARVTVTQQFANPSKTPIEAVYTFPLPGDAAVDDMTMTIGGTRVVKGEIKRREEAREIYEAAKSQGKAAALLDQERPNIFTQAVANIMPGENVAITISYVHLLKYEEGRYEWVFPMVVGPRYVPGGGYTVPGKRGAHSPTKTIEDDPGATSVVTDADKITPPITPEGTRAGHDIGLTVNLDAGVALGEVASVLHKVDVRRAGRSRATIRLRDQATIPNKDFILRFTPARAARVESGLLTYAAKTRSGNGGGYFTLILQPPAAAPRAEVTPKEMVFVIDQTGSQGGWPIAKAKETMRHCIQNLNPGDTFQLLGFTTDVFPCFPEPVPATPETVQKALAYLAPLEGAGGTDILKAADYALKIPDDPDRVRIICFMTDGYVGNDMQILDYVGKNRGRARMFPFGVGNGVNRFLIEGMAREGRGQAEFVTLEEPGKIAAAKFYRRVADPLLLDISVDWGGLPVENVFPRHIPDVFSSQPIILKGRYTKSGSGTITVHGLLRGKPWSQTLSVTLPENDKDGSAIATLWARERIEDLQNQDWLGAQTGKRNETITQQIVATALEYRLMSQYTSFVAVEEKIVNVGGKQRTIDVPVEMPEGVSYDGIFGERKETTLALQVRGRAALGRGGTAYYFRPGAAGGFGGGVPAPSSSAVTVTAPAQIAAAPVAKAAPAGANASRFGLADETLASDAAGDAAGDIRDGTAESKKRLAALKPGERHDLLRQAKLAPALLAALKPGSPAKTLDVQIWLNNGAILPKDYAARLKALGFTLSATLTPNKLLLGTIRSDKLDALIALSWVRRVEPPRFKQAVL